jgi:hypothetical protein
MLGRSFKALREFQNDWSPHAPENLSRHEGLQVDLPACTTLELVDCSIDYLRFLFCSNVQFLRWLQPPGWTTFDLTALNSLRDFLFTLPCLKNLYIFVPQTLGVDSLIHFVVCGAWEQGVWRDMISVEVEIEIDLFSDTPDFSNQTVGHRQRGEKWWKTFAVTKKERRVIVRASM